MVQSFCVVNCWFCETFQGQQVKKEKKWTCKICGEKQSFRKIFAQGSGKECQIVVQKLNRMKGHVDEQEKEYLEDELQCKQEFSERNNEVRSTSDSKWKQFIHPEQEFPKDNNLKVNDEEDYFTTERDIFNKHKGKKRKKTNGQECPRKIQRHDVTTKNKKITCTHDLWSGECKTSETNLVKPVDLDGSNNLSANYCEYQSKENEINNLHQSSSCSSQVLPTCTKPSKWSKYA